MSLHVEGRRWFQRTYGNTYHSVRVYLDGALAWKSVEHYGYGDQFIETALAYLRTLNNADGSPRFPALLECHSNGNPKHCGTLALREILHGTYSVIDVSRERDL